MYYCKRLVTLATLFFSCHLFAENTQATNFSEYKKKFQAQHKAYKEDYLERYKAYRKKIKEKWGVAELSSKTEYIHYDDKLNTKVVTDFEHDIIEINIQDGQNLSPSQINNIIEKSIINSLEKQPNKIATTQADLAAPIKSSQKNTPTNATDTVLTQLGVKSPKSLKKIIKTAQKISPEKQNKIVISRTKERLNKQINELDNIVKNSELSAKQRKSSTAVLTSLKTEKAKVIHDANALTQKNIQTYKIALKRERFDKASQFLNAIENNAKQWQIPAEMILAITETESHFNPLAKSHIPAYGLMQIVPATAGKDVNTKLFGKDHKPTATLLYTSNENIKYGTAYFHILMNRYLKEVEHPTSRLYCAIAAYNTGIGNVARAFNKGKKNRLQAIEVINKLTPDEVYQILKKRTHTETQRYLDKVLSSKQYFSKQRA